MSSQLDIAPYHDLYLLKDSDFLKFVKISLILCILNVGLIYLIYVGPWSTLFLEIIFQSFIYVYLVQQTDSVRRIRKIEEEF
jgi:hypothetical protein